MHKRRTLKERHQRKIRNFELMHPKNKHVIHRQELRNWLIGTSHSLFSEAITEMAANGNQEAQKMITMLGLVSNGFYL